jgi:aminoglycoside phosphotransferase (APT) family kinase protein
MRAGTPSLLVESLDAITPVWVNAMLMDARVAAPPVEALDIDPIGHGTTSSVARLTLRYTGEPGDAPDRLIAKIARPGGTTDGDLFGYEREVEAYRFMGGVPPCRLPRCYLAQYRADGRFTLILEDLTGTCRPGDQIAGCSIEEARAVARELAALHAATFDDPALTAARWPRRRATTARRSAALFAKGAMAMRERFGSSLGSDALTAIDAVLPLVERWSARAPTLSSLIHTDPRVDNILFGTAGGQTAAWLIDLQQMAMGNPAYDLAYFLTGSMAPDDRTACERELVALHADILASRQPGYDRDKAWAAYRAHSIAGLVATVSAASALPPGPAVDGILLTLASRNCAAVIALDGVNAIEAELGRREISS